MILDLPTLTSYPLNMMKNEFSTFILDDKEYTYIQAMKILMKGYKNTIQNRKDAHTYLMWKCKKRSGRSND